MLETRKRFHDELAALESEVLGLGERAERAIAKAVQALVHKDDALAEQVIAEDDALDATYLDIEQRILNLLAADRQLLEWGIRMNVVSRQLERVGDHAVDIGEQVAFLLTGEFKEFTDASHTTAP